MNIKNFFVKIWSYAIAHKVISAAVLVAVLVGGYYTFQATNKTGTQTRYVLAEVANQTINTSVSGTGQVAASSQLALNFGASGTVTYLNAVSGQKVSTGTLLAEIDTTDQQKTIRDAQSSLESAQISLQKIEGDSSLTVPLNKQTAQDQLNTDYETAYNNVSNTFIDLPGIMSGLDSMLHGNAFSVYQNNLDFYTYSTYNYDEAVTTYRASVDASYTKARTSYDKAFADYKATSRFSDNATIDSITSETYETIKNVAQAIKDTNNLIQFYKDTLTTKNIPTNSIADTNLTSLSGYASKTNSDSITLLNSQSTIKSDKTSISNSDLDIQSQKLSLTKAENALADAKSNLSNYYIYAPFDGVVGTVSIQKGANASSGSSAITFITQKDITSISLNEVDVTKIKLGNKAMLTFDAIDGLTIAGQVTQIDTIGTVSQGVVSYNVQIAFDTQDDRIKPGMSVNANIITETKQNVLAVPNSAVKTKSGASYVLVLSQKQDLTSAGASQGFISAVAPTQKTVQIGISDSTNTEITGGLTAGDQVVSRTIAGTATTTSSSTSKTTTRATQSLIGGGGPPN